MKVSVIVPTYRSGPALERLLRSLDAQTMAPGEFEVLLVDDGSPTETVAYLRALAAARPWVTVHELAHSGWPSRPRNVGVRLAQGEYVVFADHDDTFFPDALRAAYAFAREERLDVVNGKEVRTDRPGWGLPVYDGDGTWDRDDAPPFALAPMTPHKLYRRAFLLEHAIGFPERAHHMWEDNLFNVEVFAAAARVGVLGSVPFYHWQRGETTSSSSYSRDMGEYWDSVGVVLDHLGSTLDEPGVARVRDALVADRLKIRVLGRFGRASLRRRASTRARDREQARALLDRWLTADVAEQLSPRHRTLAEVVSRGGDDELRALVERDVTGRARPTGTAWAGRELRVTGEARWRQDDGAPLRFVASEGRLVRDVHVPNLAASLAVSDWSAAVRGVETHLVLRHRASRTSWRVPTTSAVELVDLPDGGATVVVQWQAAVDPTVAAGGAPLDDGVWDVVVETFLGGFVNRRGLDSGATVEPAVVDATVVVPYRTRAGRLALDVGETAFSLLSRSAPRWDGEVVEAGPGGEQRVVVPLDGVHAAGHGDHREILNFAPRHSGLRLQPWLGRLPGPVRTIAGWTRTGATLHNDGSARMELTVPHGRLDAVVLARCGDRELRTGWVVRRGQAQPVQSADRRVVRPPQPRATPPTRG